MLCCSGGKSIHAVFKNPGNTELEKIHSQQGNQAAKEANAMLEENRPEQVCNDFSSAPAVILVALCCHGVVQGSIWSDCYNMKNRSG